MIQKLASLDACMDFIGEISRDPAFSDPMLSTPEQIEVNLRKAVEKPDDHVLGVYREGKLEGLFVFLILPEERYIEMIVGLSRSREAYAEIAAYLMDRYPGFQADFVFNPANAPLRDMLHSLGASFDAEQQKMVFSGACPFTDTEGIEALSDRYKAQYIEMHDPDVYWTGDKVADAPQRFHVFLAVDHGVVVGYLDVTRCFGENEIYNLEVREAERRKGWGRKLVVKALERNRPNGMMLLVDVGNTPAVSLYESVGFETVPGQNSLTATWMIKEKNG